MNVYLVRYHHADTLAWHEHLAAHTQWLLQQLTNHTLLASGPIETTTGRGAVLIMEAADRATLDAILATDPYLQHDLVDDLRVTPWNPLFGAFQGISTLPHQLAQAPLGEWLTHLGA